MEFCRGETCLHACSQGTYMPHPTTARILCAALHDMYVSVIAMYVMQHLCYAHACVTPQTLAQCILATNAYRHTMRPPHG